MTINDIAEHLIISGCKLIGCSPGEVAKIERTYNTKLPAVYIEFLLSMGKGAGRYMLGSSIFYDEIFTIGEGAMDLLEDNNFRPLPENSFVFYMHQGYQFAFFNLADGDNPPVYYYCEGQEDMDFEKKAVSFTAFLESQMEVSDLY